MRRSRFLLHRLMPENLTFYQGTSALETSFFLIGGQYTLYVYAKRPVVGYRTSASKSCIFGGNLQRVWTTHDALSLGSGVTISTIVPHKIGPARALNARRTLQPLRGATHGLRLAVQSRINQPERYGYRARGCSK